MSQRTDRFPGAGHYPLVRCHIQIGRQDQNKENIDILVQEVSKFKVE
jgi:hypothetical protein